MSGQLAIPMQHPTAEPPAPPSLLDLLEPADTAVDDHAGDAADKRAVAQLLSWWMTLCGPADLPRLSAVDHPMLDPIRHRLFLIDAPESAARVPVITGHWLAGADPLAGVDPILGAAGGRDDGRMVALSGSAQRPAALTGADGITWRRDLAWQGVQPSSPAGQLPESLWSVVFAMLYATLEYREPLTQSDWVDLTGAARLLYRVILAPLSADGTRATHCLGALSCKVVAA